jgi:hypothetical protein
MSGSCFLGIDPGAKGGLALLSEADGLLIEPIPTNDDGIDLKELARLIRDFSKDTRVAYLEELNAFPGMNIAGVKTLWRGIGVLHGMLIANGVETFIVRPQEWMKVMHKGLEGKDTKVKSHLAAKRIFPNVDFLATERSKVPHEGMVEAALIAEFGRRKTMGAI